MRKKELDWEKIDPLLGVMSDKKIAAKCKVSATPVRSRRLALGIPAYVRGQERDWTSIDQMLKAGVPIKDIALAFDIHDPTLNDRRRKLGLIPPKPEPPCWPEIDPLLGTMHDSELVLIFNVPISAIAARRKKFGIPAYLEWEIIDWSEVDPYLGSCVDREIAERAGISLSRVASRRRRLGIPAYSGHVGSKEKINWGEIEPYLGTMPDGQLAKKFNISPSSVGRKRLDMGIEAYKPPESWRKDKRLFKKRSNMELAKIFRVSTSSVGSARTKLGMTKPKKDLSFIDPYLDVLSDAEIAEMFGMAKLSVYNRRYRIERRAK